MCEQGEGEFVLFVSKSCRHLLEKRFVRAVTFHHGAEPFRFALETKTRGSFKNAADARFRQILQWRLAAPRPRERDIDGERLGERGQVHAHLQHVPMGSGPAEEGVLTRVDEDVKDRFLKTGIDGVPMRFPAPIRKIELDAAMQDCTVIQADGGAFEIRPGLTIPDAELHDLDLLAADAAKLPPEVAREPARL